MALDKDILGSVEGLTDEQIQAIESLSKNDEDQVIGKRIGEVHQSYENDFKELTGFDKENGEKSYNFIKRGVTSLIDKSTSSSELESNYNSLLQEKEELMNKIKEGKGNEEISTKYDSLKNEMSSLKTQYENSLLEKDQQISKILEEQKLGRITSILKKSAPSLNESLNENQRSMILDTTLSSVLNKYNVDLEGDSLVFKSKDDDTILRNKDNYLQPFTANEILKNELSDWIGNEKTKTGGGGSSQNGKTNHSLIISGAKNRIEADMMIDKHLKEQGLQRGSMEFVTKKRELRKENNVSELPFK